MKNPISFKRYMRRIEILVIFIVVFLFIVPLLAPRKISLNFQFSNEARTQMSKKKLKSFFVANKNSNGCWRTTSKQIHPHNSIGVLLMVFLLIFCCSLWCQTVPSRFHTRQSSFLLADIANCLPLACGINTKAEGTWRMEKVFVNGENGAFNTLKPVSFYISPFCYLCCRHFHTLCTFVRNSIQ